MALHRKCRHFYLFIQKMWSIFSSLAVTKYSPDRSLADLLLHM
jgi:hypothetical protein